MYFPCLQIYFLKVTRQGKNLVRYLNQNKGRHNTTSFTGYSLYVHGYFLPWLDSQREKGLLKQGKQFNFANKYSWFKDKLSSLISMRRFGLTLVKLTTMERHVDKDLVWGNRSLSRHLKEPGSIMRDMEFVRDIIFQFLYQFNLSIFRHWDEPNRTRN